MRTLEEAILHTEEVANDYEGMIGDYALDSEKLAKCAEEHRQIATWLRELQERRKTDNCKGCVSESRKGYLLVCSSCKRNYVDLYVSERKTNDKR